MNFYKWEVEDGGYKREQNIKYYTKPKVNLLTVINSVKKQL